MILTDVKNIKYKNYKLKKRKLVAVPNGTDKVWVAVTGGITGAASSFLQLVKSTEDAKKVIRAIDKICFFMLF
jgi:hypothetical protein